MLKVLYTIFLAIMLAFFIGLGIEAFYPGPKAPEYPTSLEGEKVASELSPEEKQVQETFDRDQKTWLEDNRVHSRNTSIIAVAISVLILVLSLTALAKIDIMSDGFMLGGLLTLLYGIIRGFESDNSKFRFVMVSVGLAVALILGYVKFIKPKEAKKAKL